MKRVMILVSAAMLAAMACSTATAQQSQQQPRRITVDRDNVVIRESCIVIIPPNAVIADADGNGVIHIEADDITVTFAEASVLRGAAGDVAGDQLSGFGIRLQGRSNVTLRNLQVQGYRTAVYATEADGLTIEHANLRNHWRKRLASTALAEDGSDWIHPHRNDNNEWLRQYGATIYIEDSRDVTVRNVVVREGQNGIVFDRVDHSKVYDNDASFLSGWGLALWRSSDNVITRNAFDFCVRGHSEGVYNRGQDSAGILFFEQCSRNIVAENSATHGGDGFFGFAGLEALGLPDTLNRDLDYKRIGCNDNLFIRNDFSYAPAHGLELTFSFGNKIIENRFVENAICGVWAGYGQETLIANNLFDGNGGMPYGLERGGVNIEHSINNTIVDNQFINNRVGVHLWYRNPGDVMQWAWGKENYRELDGNVIARNAFVINDEPRPFHSMQPGERHAAIWLRDEGRSGRLKPVVIHDNTFEVDERVGEVLRLSDDTQVREQAVAVTVEVPDYPVFGESRPVGARAHLAGRHNIIMHEWGPWDHESPMIRMVSQSGGTHEYEVLGVQGNVRAQSTSRNVRVRVVDGPIENAKRIQITGNPGVNAYDVRLTAGTWREQITGTIIHTEWRVTFFNYDPRIDPREAFDRWPVYPEGHEPVTVSLDKLDFPFGMGGPSHQDVPDVVRQANIHPDHFGMVAQTRVTLEPGRWRITTLSDDGVRVWVDDDKVIDNWTWHAATTDVGEFTVQRRRPVTLRVMYFELDGGAVFKLDLDRVE